MGRLEEIEKEKQELNKSLRELQEQNAIKQKILDDEKASLIRQEQNELIEKLRKNKEFILSLLEHDRNSCMHYDNGWDGDNYECSKCALKDVLDNPHLLPDNVKISFDVNFYHI